MMKMRSIYFTLCVCFLIGISSCKQNEITNGTSGDAPATDTVVAFVLKAQPVTTTIQLPGELRPYNKARLYPKVQGYLKEIKVDIGSVVKSGQVLAVLEAPELKARYAETLASQQAANSKFQTSKDQWKRLQSASKVPNAVAPFDLEKVQNQMRADSAQLESAKQLVNASRELAGYLVVRAPFSGKVTQRAADPGDLVSTSTVILTVEDQSLFRLQVSIPEIYGSASPQNKISFVTDVYPGQKFEANLARVAGAIDQKTRTELWEFEVRNDKNLLKSGMFVYALLELSRTEPGFVVSPVTVATTLEKKFVARVSNKQIEWVDVRQGFMIDKKIEIFGDLQDGDTVLIRGTDEIKAGTRVAPRLVSTN